MSRNIARTTRRNSIGLIVAGILFAGCPAVHAADCQWSGAVDGKWETSGNWTGDKVPGAEDTAVFDGEKNSAIELGADTTVGGISFGANAGAFTITGHTLLLPKGGKIVMAHMAKRRNQTISSDIRLGGDATFTNNNDWELEESKLVLDGHITGSANITITSPEVKGTGGGIDLKGDNAATFTGNIKLVGGLLIVDNRGALGDVKHSVILQGGELWFNGDINTQNNFLVTGDVAWQSFQGNAQAGNITVQPHATWTIGNGGGNPLDLSGSIAGSGTIKMTCGNTTLDGSTANSFTGKIHFDTETDTADYQQLRLAKTGGAQAIAGDLELGGKANVVWKEDNQISEKSNITLAGGRLSPDGHSNKLGKLIVTGPAYIDLDGGDGKLQFAGSGQEKWKAGGQLLIAHWKEKGKAGVYVGNSPSGLSAEQIKNIGFENPAGMDAGVYHAELSDSGELLPTHEMIQAVNPPFDLSVSAQAARKAIYDVHGLEDLTEKDTPLKKGMKISIFGDSITWLNGYITAMDEALAKGEGTHDLDVKIFNHGVNGGGVLQIRDGSQGASFNGKDNNGSQASFADVIAADHADVAVVYIGINDVWWRNTSPGDFEKAMRDIAAAAKAHGTKLVLVTMSVHGENPDGSNPDDKKIEQFCKITRDVAASTGATLVDLRKVYIAYLQNNNWKLHLDGSLVYQQSGVLTYDGVHPTGEGVKMLSNHIAEGIYQCLTNSKAQQ